jgi:hypothetical protein
VGAAARRSELNGTALLNRMTVAGQIGSVLDLIGVTKPRMSPHPLGARMAEMR